MPRDISLGEGKRGAPASTSDTYRVEYKAGQDCLLVGVQLSVDLTGSLSAAQQQGYFRAAVHNGPASEGGTYAAGNVGTPQGATGIPLADHACPFPFCGGSPTMIWLFKVMRAGDVVTVEVGEATLDGSAGATSFQANVSFVALPLADFNLPTSFPRLR